jgi:hypothetical protein
MKTEIEITSLPKIIFTVEYDFYDGGMEPEDSPFYRQRDITVHKVIYKDEAKNIYDATFLYRFCEYFTEQVNEALLTQHE